MNTKEILEKAEALYSTYTSYGQTHTRYDEIIIKNEYTYNRETKESTLKGTYIVGVKHVSYEPSSEEIIIGLDEFIELFK